MEVTALHFSAFTEAQRQNMAVVECTEATIYNADGTPKDSGVMSLMLGVTGHRMFCRTCKNTQDKCPGHYGLVRFAKEPVYAGLWFQKRLPKVLSMLCFYCSRLIVDLERLPQDIHNLSDDDLYARAGKLKKLKGGCPHCGMSVQPKYTRAGQTIETEWPQDAKYEDEEHEAFCKLPFTPARARNILRAADTQETQKYLRMDNLADMMVPASMLVLPVQGRAPHVVKNVKTEADSTRQLANIVKFNENIKTAERRKRKAEDSLQGLDEEHHALFRLRMAKLMTEAVKHVARVQSTAKGDQRQATAVSNELASQMELEEDPETMRKRLAVERKIQRLTEEIEELNEEIQLNLQNRQRAVHEHTDRDYSGGEAVPMQRKKRNNHMKKVESCATKLQSKQGLFRKHLIGNRLNNTARAVISHDPRLEPYEVSVPFELAKVLTTPTRVTSWNMEDAKQWVCNGMGVRRGAHSIEKNQGYTVSLKGLSDLERAAMAQKLEVGMVIHRQLEDGDWIFVNRQPSLHKYSMLWMRVRITYELTIGLHYAPCTALAADFDGDEVNLVWPQEEESRAECSQLATMEANMINVAKNKPMFVPLQDVVAAVWMLTVATCWLTVENFCDIVCAIRHPTRPMPSMYDPSVVDPTTGKVHGRRVFDYMFPPTLQYHQAGVHIVNGRITPDSGPLANKHVGSTRESLLLVMHKDFSPKLAMNFLGDMGMVSDVFLHRVQALSTGLSDICFEPEIVQKFQNAVQACKATYALQKTPADQLLSLGPLSVKAERLMKESAVYNDPDNGFRTMTDSGARGKTRNHSQVGLFVDQQILIDDRMGQMKAPDGDGDRVASFFDYHDESPESGGLVTQSYLQGLSGEQFFIHCLSGRAGIGTTSCTTSQLGYLYRRLYALISSIVVDGDGSVRIGGDKKVIMPSFLDNFTPEHLEQFVAERLFVPHKDARCYLEVLRHTLARCRTIAMRNPDNVLWVPLNWERRVTDWIATQTPRPANVTLNEHEMAVKIRSEVVDTTSQFARKLMDLPQFRLLQQAYNIMDAVDHHLTVGMIETYGFHTRPLALQEFIGQLIEDTERQVHRARTPPGEAVGSTAAFCISEPCTQSTLSTFHHTGDKHAPTKDLVKGLLLLSERKGAVHTVFVKPTGRLCESREEVWRIAQSLLPVRLKDLLVDKRSIQFRAMKTQAQVAAVCKGVPAFEMGIMDVPKLDCTGGVWTMQLSTSAIQKAQVTMPMIVETLERKLMSGCCVWAAPFHSLVDQETVTVHVAGMGAGIDPVVMFHKLHLKGFVEVVTATMVPCPRPRAPGEPPEYEVRARTKSLEPFFLSSVFDPRTLRCNCPLTTYMHYGIEAGQAALGAAFKQALNNGVHSHHTSLVAAHICRGGRPIKMDRFDMAKDSDDVMQQAAFESTKLVLLKAASHKKCTRNISRSVVSSTIMRVTPAVGTGAVQVVVPPDLAVSQLKKKLRMDSKKKHGAEWNGRRRFVPHQATVVLIMPNAHVWDMSRPPTDHLDAFDQFAAEHNAVESSGESQKRRRQEDLVAARPVAAPLPFVNDEFRPTIEPLAKRATPEL
jgi:DNA-directed RNA polymerase beta' subunit